jgi:NTP pyrophosphatase (non-canonical NTP hydrolase)
MVTTSPGTQPPDLPENAAEPPIHSILDERRAQEARWGIQRHSWPEWVAILTEEVGEAAHEAIEEHWHPSGDLSRLRAELVQVAAVAVAMIEQIDDPAHSSPT